MALNRFVQAILAHITPWTHLNYKSLELASSYNV